MSQYAQEDIALALITMVAEIHAESGVPYHREIKLDDSLQRRLGMDSLARAELFQRIEKKFQIALPDKMLAEVDTLSDLIRFLQETPAISPLIIEPAKKITHVKTVHADPSAAKTLIEVLQCYCEQTTEQTHIYFQNENGQVEKLTYMQLWQSAMRVAQGLKQLGLQEKEAVAIMQPTHLGFFYTFIGTLLAGGIPVPIYPPFRTHMLEVYAKTEARILSNAEVRILVTFDRVEQLSKLLQAFVPSLKVVTTVDQLLKYDELTKPFITKAQDSAFIQYTSGSTNDPKGVLLNHANLLANIRAYGKSIEVVPTDVVVSWLPLYHDFGLIGAWLGSFYHGVPLVLMTPFTFLNHPERWLWAMHYYGGTLAGAPNFAYELCVRKIQSEQMEGLDLSSWRIAANGAEKVYPRTLEAFSKKFAAYGLKANVIKPVYGLAESTVCLTVPPLESVFRIDHVDRKQFEEQRVAIPTQEKNDFSFAGCGVPIPGHEIRIVDDDNKILPERHVGNLQFRGPSSMQGYFNNPRATQAIYHDGWFDTGDLAYIADEELFVTGRRKDLIIKAGRNLYPAEIEELVGNVSGVRQGCVVAFGVIDSERGTEQLVVVAETREDDKTNRQVLLEAINETLATTLDMVPDHIELVKPRTVPKTSSGKLQRHACKVMYLEGRLHSFHVPPWMQISKLGIKWSWRKSVSGVATLGKIIYTGYLFFWMMLLFWPAYLIVLFASSKVAAQACRMLARTFIFFAGWRLRIRGEENLQQSTAVIYAANHASYLDGLVALAILPAGTRFVGKRELLGVPFVRTFMHKLNCIFVDRTDFSQGIVDVESMQKTLHQGESVFMFPEGTFGYAIGLRPFRLGAFKVAAETNTPICPIALNGTRMILRDSEKLFSLGRITVTASELIRAMGTDWQDITQLRQNVRTVIAKDCGEPSLDLIAAQTVAPKER